jgi:hypothetical protein
MPIKSALAIALAVILPSLAAPPALAAPPEPAKVPAQAPKPKTTGGSADVPHAHPSAPKRSKMGTAPAGKRKHDARPKVDTKPEGHGPAIAMTKPIALAKPVGATPKVEPLRPRGDKRAPAKPLAKRADGKKKGDAKKAESDGIPVVAAAISADLPEPASDERKPLTIKGRLDPKKKPPCLKAPIDVARGTDQVRLSLAKCDGTILETASETMSVLLRPGGAPSGKGTHIDTRLLERFDAIVGHFAKTGVTTKIEVISGYRPSSAGSYHASGRAMDFRMEGVKNEELVAFCKTLEDTGCGYYPNSSFVHVDVRDPGTGHVAWIDASGPGEAPEYVASWPPPADTDVHKEKDARQMIEDLLSTLEKELPTIPRDDHPPLPAPNVSLQAPAR